MIAGISDSPGTPPTDAGLREEGASADGATPADSGLPPCAPGGNAADSPTRIHASKVKVPVDVNGDDPEWRCVDRLALTGGQRVVGLDATRGVADLAMQWDEDHLYFWARVKTRSAGGASPGGTSQKTQNFFNDSVHLYVSSPTPGTAYTAADRHVVFDWMNQITDYTPTTVRPSLAGMVAKVGLAKDEGGSLSFVVEASVEVQSIGRTKLAAGETVGVNFQVNDAPDVGNNYRIWFRDVAVCQARSGCDLAGGSEPYCDPRCMGGVVLVP